jgi:hypothetical protein
VTAAAEIDIVARLAVKSVNPITAGKGT